MSESGEDADEASFFLDFGSAFPQPSPEVPKLKSRRPRRVSSATVELPPPAAADPIEPILLPDEEETAEEPPYYLGHRQRVRDRFNKIGGEAFEDYELLEIALFGVIPRGDTKPVAKRLLKRFGTFAEVIGAPRHLLMEVEGVGENAATDIRVLAAVAQRLTRGAVIKREALTSWSAILDYLRASMAFNEIEAFRVLYLNKKNLLVSDEVQQEGIVDHTPAYPSKVINRAYNLGATAIVLVHNHPSGDPEPSRADIDLTKAIINAGKGHNIVVHDHIIVARNGHTSLRAGGYI